VCAGGGLACFFNLTSVSVIAAGRNNTCAIVNLQVFTGETLAVGAKMITVRWATGRQRTATRP
jgi:hypothetical protein